MIYSMTAFARQNATSELGQLTLEIKSVNHRFSEVSLRIPEDLRFLEQKIREKISASIKRGKVDCVFKYQAPELQVNSLTINTQLVAALTHANTEIESMLEVSAPLKAIEFLKWPGVIQPPAQDVNQLADWALQLLTAGLKELLDTRAREGAQLSKLLLERCCAMEEEVRKVQHRMPQALLGIRQRLTDRLAELKSQLDESRLEQEMILFTHKADVSEEMDRLRTHIDEVKRLLDKGSPVGRRLDFLMQEMNREANTLGSKSIDTELTKASIELKVLIEQMREQIQNIE